MSAAPTPPSPSISTELAYQQLCEDFRALNAIFWQTPVIVMTLTGGLWFSVATFDLTDHARDALLIFGAVADAVIIFCLFRLRSVMRGLQTQIRTLDGRDKLGLSYQIVWALTGLLALALAGSLYAAAQSDAFFDRDDRCVELKA